MLSSLTPQQFRVIVALLVVLSLVLVALIVVQLAGPDDSAPAATQTTSGPTTVPATDPPTTESVATTVAPATTVAEATTPTTEAATTTVVPTTTSTTLPETTTTTSIPAPPEVVLEANGLGSVAFGEGVPETIAIVTAGLGAEPDRDTQWVDFFDNPYGTCPPPEVRGVEWGMLILLFTSAETDFAAEGTRHFFSYIYAPHDEKPGAGPHGLATSEGIGLGSTTEDLTAAYEDRLQIFDDEVVGVFFAIDLDFTSDTALGGTLTDAGPTGLVGSLLGGTGCGE